MVDWQIQYKTHLKFQITDWEKKPASYFEIGLMVFELSLLSWMGDGVSVCVESFLTLG